MKEFISQAAKLLKEHKLHRRQLKIFLCLAVIVAFGTVTALKLYGQAMTHQMEVLDCKYTVHEHTEECYAKDEQGNPVGDPICGYADYVIHTHNEDCRDGKGNLVCTLEEHEKHEHTDECYEIERVLICGLEETEAPAEGAEGTPEGETPAAGGTPEGEAPAAEGTPGAEAPAAGNTPEAGSQPETGSAAAAEPVQEEKLVCQTEAHAHDESCYEKALSCGQEEHAHGEGCATQELTCGAEEHTHGEGCATKELTCGTEEHAHVEGCYDEEGNLTCGMQEHAHGEGCYTTTYTCGHEEHTHGEGCYTVKYTCGMEEHTHDDSCYTSNLICGKEEHEHAEGCYESVTVPATADETGAAEGAAPSEGTAGTDNGADAAPAEPTEPESDAAEESVPTGHVHTDECYEEVKTLICKEQELHVHDNSCYAPECFDEAGNLIEGSLPSCGLLQLEEHVHVHTDGEDSCFATVELTPEEVAALENGATLHIHTEECYDGEGNLICGHDADHAHMPQCYDDAGKLICGYGTASHVHEDKCYDESGNLVCGYDTASHVHEESCYDAEGNLQCGYETAKHAHGESCYDADGNLICGYDTATHVHEKSCYDADGNLICGYGTASHVHEESCYDAEGNLQCGYKTEDAVELDGKFIYEADDYTLEIHIKGGIDSDITQPDMPVESKKENNSASEVPDIEESSVTEPSTNDKSVEDEQQDQTDESIKNTDLEDSKAESSSDSSSSSIEELSEVYEDDTDTTVPEREENQGGEENISTGINSDDAERQTEPDAQILIADEENGLTLKMAPLDAEEEIYAEMTNFVEGFGNSKLLDLSVMELHVYQDGKEIDISSCTVAMNITPKAMTTEEISEAFGEEVVAEEDVRIVVSALRKTADGVQDSGNVFLTPDMEEVPVLQNVVVENGILAIARYVSNKTITKTFEGENFIVTATYKPDANIPAEAELIAEQITKESDSEHYAQREAEYQEALDDGMATMQALLKIGFYVDGEEVEPESPVTITIQFLDENGLAEDRPITVIHFAEDGTELLDGGDAVDNSTTFRTNSLSEFAVGYGDGEGGQKVVLSDSFQYNDAAVHITFHIEGEATALRKEQEDIADDPNEQILTSDVDSMMVLKVKILDEGKERYQTYCDYLESDEEQNGTLFLQVMSYRLFYKGRELDLSGCTVTAEVEPTANLVESAQAMPIQEEEEEPSTTNFLSVFSLSPDGIEVQENVAEMIAEKSVSADFVIEQNNETIEEEEKRENTDIAVAVIVKVNPKFIVQFYANLNVPESSSGTSGTTIPFIDTSKASGLGRLPKNGEKTPNIISLGINSDGSVNFNIKETEIYKQEEREFNPKLGDKFDVDYLNSLRNNAHYTAVQLWVLNEVEGETRDKRNERASGTNKSDWTSYDLTNDGAKRLAFTNNPNLKDQVDDKGRSYVLIEEGTVMRMVYNPVQDSYRPKATFYDYDISDGPKNATKMKTTCYGINSHFPTGVTSGRYAFGNNNMGTDFGTDIWRDNGYDNKLNMTNKINTYQGLTLGLVQGMETNPEDGSMDVKFSNGVTGPSIGLFGNKPGTGKIIYPDWNLKFNREGDTFTLSEVSMSNDASVASNLEKFKHPGSYSIWTNNFWPLDVKWHQQDKISDPMFGGDTRPDHSKGKTPPSDDGIDHNSYFGMTYSVNFDLVKEYIGPLEYYFYGDDDMWVFLDGKLVCDIGGVHSSVGEYVDLWDYIDGGKEGHEKGQHTLSVFYTERGASGSSCWMQFTVPQISQIYRIPYEETASLTIRKVAEQFPDDKKDIEFPFALRLSGIYNNYTVRRIGSDGTVLETNQISTEEYSFVLKSGEYLEVIALPIGTHYWVEERYLDGENWDTTVDTEVGGSENNSDGSNKKEPERTVLAEGTLDGTVVDGKDKVDHVIVTYTNYYLYTLPETGGSGTILYTMAGGIVLLFGAGFLYKRKFRERRG